MFAATCVDKFFSEVVQERFPSVYRLGLWLLWFVGELWTPFPSNAVMQFYANFALTFVDLPLGVALKFVTRRVSSSFMERVFSTASARVHTTITMRHDNEPKATVSSSARITA